VEAQRLITVEVLPRWGGRPINSIRRRDVFDLHDVITDSGRPVLANRVVRTLRRLFSWAMERELIDSSPAARIRGIRETPRDRVLYEAELHAIWSGAAAIGWPYGPFVQLLILTAQRRNEVAGMRWSELTPT
jgi:integrase